MAAMRAEQDAQAGRRPPTVAEERASYELIADLWPVPRDVSITPVEVAGRPAEWRTAWGGGHGRTVLYLHGGGYVIGSLATHRDLASRVSRSSASRVLLLDYRLAPEHPFPAAVEDALAAFRWLLSQGRDPRCLAIAGDSAGGGLAMATLVGLRDAGDALPAAAVCLSPWADLALSGDSMQSRASADPAVDRATLQRWAGYYLAGAYPRQPLASPLYADPGCLPSCCSSGLRRCYSTTRCGSPKGPPRRASRSSASSGQTSVTSSPPTPPPPRPPAPRRSSVPSFASMCPNRPDLRSCSSAAKSPTRPGRGSSSRLSLVSPPSPMCSQPMSMTRPPPARTSSP